MMDKEVADDSRGAKQSVKWGPAVGTFLEMEGTGLPARNWANEREPDGVLC